MKSWEFQQVLEERLGAGAKDFSPALRKALFEVYQEGFRDGAEWPHTCGDFDPGGQGPVGPDGCEACKILDEGLELDAGP